MKDEPASRGLPGVDPLTDPGVRNMVADIAHATHSSEDTVRVLFVDACETLRRDARILGFVPLLAAKRVRKLLQQHAHRAP